MKDITVSAAIINLDDKILICQRKADDRKHPLKWEFPGGKAEAGEAADESLVRELQEELGIQVLEQKLIMNYRVQYEESPPIHLYFYAVSEYLSTVKNRVFNEIRWVTLKELGHYDFLEGDRRIVEALIHRDVLLQNACLDCSLKQIFQ